MNLSIYFRFYSATILYRRRNWTSVNNVCEAAPRSLFWASDWLNELPEVRFIFPFITKIWQRAFLPKKLGSLRKGVFEPRTLTGSEAFPLSISGAPNVNFRKISVLNTIWDLEFSEHFFWKISCLPASPRIFEHLKYGIIGHF